MARQQRTSERKTTRRGRLVVCGPLGEKVHMAFDKALETARKRCTAECLERGHMTIKRGGETVYVVTPFNEYEITNERVELVR
jgi:hypothetical protein